MEASKRAKVLAAMQQVSESEVREMRAWLEDCGADCSGRTAFEIVSEVELQYDGGLTEWFLVQAEEREMREDYRRQFATRPEVR